MNLISLEEHFFFTGAKTKDGSYYDLSSDIRAMRSRLMEGLVEKHEGETWCATKHLLSGTIRLIEVGNRYSKGNKKSGDFLMTRIASTPFSGPSKRTRSARASAEGGERKGVVA